MKIPVLRIAVQASAGIYVEGKLESVPERQREQVNVEGVFGIQCWIRVWDIPVVVKIQAVRKFQ